MAQTQIRIGKAQIHVANEAVQDTYVPPAGDGTGIFLAQNVTFTLDSANWEPNYVRSNYQKMDEVSGTKAASISFEVPIKGQGAAGSPPEWSEALKGCGFEYTDTGTTSTEYTPMSVFDDTGGGTGNPGISYSVSVLEDGVRYAIAGAFGNVSFALAVGQPGMMNFTFTGAYQVVADDALETGVNAPAYNTTKPQPFMGAEVVFNPNAEGNYTPPGVENVTLDVGNVVTVIRDVTKPFGVAGARITGRKSTGSFDPEMVRPVATQDWFEHWEESKPCTLTTGTVGTTAGNIWKLDINRLVFRPPEPQDRNGVRALSVPFAVSSQTTDEEGDANEPDIKLTLT